MTGWTAGHRDPLGQHGWPCVIFWRRLPSRLAFCLGGSFAPALVIIIRPNGCRVKGNWFAPASDVGFDVLGKRMWTSDIPPFPSELSTYPQLPCGQVPTHSPPQVIHLSTIGLWITFRCGIPTYPQRISFIPPLDPLTYGPLCPIMASDHRTHRKHLPAPQGRYLC